MAERQTGGGLPLLDRHRGDPPPTRIEPALNSKAEEIKNRLKSKEIVARICLFDNVK
jgi:hypothetical protein